MSSDSLPKQVNFTQQDSRDALIEEYEEKPDPRIFRADLYNSAMNNDTEQVLIFLMDDVPCNFIDSKNGWTALHWSALHGNVSLVKKLLQVGASNPYHRQSNRKTPSKSNPKAASPVNKLSLLLQQQSINEDYENYDNNVPESNNEVEEDVILYNETALEENADDLNKEKMYDFKKNTPLCLASFKGHFEIIWLLLRDGYSCNDLDDLGNNCLHLAAASGNFQAVNTLINDGANSNLLNSYKNLPIDMATSNEIREALMVAMERYASATSEDITLMHNQSVKMYNGLIADIENVIKETSAFSSKSVDEIIYLMKRLDETLRISTEWSLDQHLLSEAKRIMNKMEITLDLISDIESLQRNLPITSQRNYNMFVKKLERTIEKANECGGIDSDKLASANDIILQSQAEYWVSTCTNRLKHVICAGDANEHDMNRLKGAIEKYDSKNCSKELISAASELYKKLYAELGMTRAVRAIPTVKLPMDNPPDGFWQPIDIGKVKETEEYPNPPADTNEYIWEPSEAYTTLKESMDVLKQLFESAQAISTVYQPLVAEAKEKLIKAEKDFKLLEVKNSADKALGIEVVIKLAKKLKRKGKRGGSAKKKGKKVIV